MLDLDEKNRSRDWVSGTRNAKDLKFESGALVRDSIGCLIEK